MSSKYMMMFDLDGTVTACETLPLIAANLGVENEISALTAKTVRGDVPFVEGFITRVNILKEYSVERIADIVATAPLHGAIVNYIRRHKDNCLLVTGNLDCWITKLASKVGCACVASMTLCSDDRVQKILRIVDKSDVVREYQEKGFCVVFVGEGNNDAEAIRSADIGIAFGKVHWPSPSAMQFATHAIFDEDELCRFLRQLS